MKINYLINPFNLYYSEYSLDTFKLALENSEPHEQGLELNVDEETQPEPRESATTEPVEEASQESPTEAGEDVEDDSEAPPLVLFGEGEALGAGTNSALDEQRIPTFERGEVESVPQDLGIPGIRPLTFDPVLLVVPEEEEIPLPEMDVCEIPCQECVDYIFDTVSDLFGFEITSYTLTCCPEEMEPVPEPEPTCPTDFSFAWGNECECGPMFMMVPVMCPRGKEENWETDDQYEMNIKGDQQSCEWACDFMPNGLSDKGFEQGWNNQMECCPILVMMPWGMSGKPGHGHGGKGKRGEKDHGKHQDENWDSDSIVEQTFINEEVWMSGHKGPKGGFENDCECGPMYMMVPVMSPWELSSKGGLGRGKQGEKDHGKHEECEENIVDINDIDEWQNDHECGPICIMMPNSMPTISDYGKNECNWECDFEPNWENECGLGLDEMIWGMPPNGWSPMVGFDNEAPCEWDCEQSPNWFSPVHAYEEEPQECDPCEFFDAILDVTLTPENLDSSEMDTSSEMMDELMDGDFWLEHICGGFEHSQESFEYPKEHECKVRNLNLFNVVIMLGDNFYDEQWEGDFLDAQWEEQALEDQVLFSKGCDVCPVSKYGEDPYQEFDFVTQINVTIDLSDIFIPPYLIQELLQNQAQSINGCHPHGPCEPIFSVTQQISEEECCEFALNSIQVIGSPLYFPAVAPVVIDLDNDGIELISQQESQVTLDVDNDGNEESIGWVSPDDGILVFDFDGDRQVTQKEEFVFSDYHPQAHTDLQGLALSFDSNQDGIFDASDELFSQFGVWQDGNSNGITDLGEFQSLVELGFSGISLSSDGQYEALSGNHLFGTSELTLTDGSKVLVGDVGLSYAPLLQDIEEELLGIHDENHQPLQKQHDFEGGVETGDYSETTGLESMMALEDELSQSPTETIA